MKEFDWFNQKPGAYFLNHVILAEKLKNLLPWSLPKLIYEGSDYDINSKVPEITEGSVFGTVCELLYHDMVFNKITFMCFEDTKTIRLEFETPDNPNYFPYQDFSFEQIEKSWDRGYLIQEIKI